MKKVITILMLAVALVAGSTSIEARTSKRASKARTTQTANVDLSVAGKTFEKTDSYGTVRLQFNEDGTGTDTASAPGYSQTIKFTWTQSGSRIVTETPNSPIASTYKMAGNGKYITDIAKFKFKLVEE